MLFSSNSESIKEFILLPNGKNVFCFLCKKKSWKSSSKQHFFCSASAYMILNFLIFDFLKFLWATEKLTVLYTGNTPVSTNFNCKVISITINLFKLFLFTCCWKSSVCMANKQLGEYKFSCLSVWIWQHSYFTAGTLVNPLWTWWNFRLCIPTWKQK